MGDHHDVHKSDTYKSMIDISRDGFRFLATLNGGTWLAVLTFVAKDASWADVQLVKCGVKWFIVSMALTALCFLGSWTSQYCLHNENHGRFREGRHMIPVVITFLMYVAAACCYAYGAWLAMEGLIL
ncbi:hypothetical protein [Bordetella sp. BOR01]|uniref:hypothetical protein n=1 Tax=Bordetella sp. BOR01 TaxID=2854779 RepID=UPI001C476BD1|nr:hypothetical protein [Bordetella sp. BOR01]MBV7482482.1 hypothetical protein [Bordetella sp. BOR01]